VEVSDSLRQAEPAKSWIRTHFVQVVAQRGQDRAFFGAGAEPGRGVQDPQGIAGAQRVGEVEELATQLIKEDVDPAAGAKRA